MRFGKDLSGPDVNMKESKEPKSDPEFSRGVRKRFYPFAQLGQSSGWRVQRGEDCDFAWKAVGFGFGCQGESDAVLLEVGEAEELGVEQCAGEKCCGDCIV